MIINISAAVFALIFFSFTALIILYLISSFLMSFIAIFLINKKMDLGLKSIVFFKPFAVFIAAFLIVFPLYYFINIPITPGIYLLNIFFNNCIKFILFAIIFYIIFYFTKVLTKEEFIQLIDIIPILHSDKKIIQKIVKLIIAFLPSDKKSK